MLLAAAQKKRQLAAVRTGTPVKGSQSFTVIKKNPKSPQLNNQTSAAATKRSLPVIKKKAQAPAAADLDAKSTLPSEAANSFDADDPEDEVGTTN